MRKSAGAAGMVRSAYCPERRPAVCAYAEDRTLRFARARSAPGGTAAIPRNAPPRARWSGRT